MFATFARGPSTIDNHIMNHPAISNSGIPDLPVTSRHTTNINEIVRNETLFLEGAVGRGL